PAKPLTKPVLSRPVATEEPARLVTVPLPEGVRPQRLGEPNERSAHLEKLKQLFEAAPISRYLGMTLGYCENGVARVRLPFRKDFEEGHGVIHGGLIGLLGDTAGNFAVGSVSPGSTVKTVEFKLSLLAGVQGDLLAIGEVVRKGRTLATCRLEVVEGNDRVIAIGLATYALQAV
ncbi:MAG TPA: PaaI family thioesterase, partial [Vicinamibacteria bacterium]